MFIAFALAMQLQDTAGMRSAFQAAVTAVAEARHDDPMFRAAEHVRINPVSFLRLLSTDTTDLSHWSDLAAPLGSRGTISSASRCETDRPCPVIYGLGLERRGDTFALRVGISIPTRGGGTPRGTTIEYLIVLVRETDGFRVASVTQTSIT